MNANDNNFENLSLGPVINTISGENFPVEYPTHWHKYVEIVAMDEAAPAGCVGILHVGSTEYRLESGDILFIWSGELHDTFRNYGGHLWGLQFFPTLLYELPDISAYLNQFRRIHKLSAAENPELTQAVQMYMRQIFNLQQERPSFKETEKIICMLEIFLTLGRHLEASLYENGGPVKSLSGDITRRIGDACNYICENYEKELSLDTVASYVGFSPSYFSRVFKQVTKYNFVEYLAIQRIRAAQTLLADSSIPIIEVSSRTGFKSISTFNRVFRQHKNCAPSEYRKYMI